MRWIHSKKTNCNRISYIFFSFLLFKPHHTPIIKSFLLATNTKYPDGKSGTPAFLSFSLFSCSVFFANLYRFEYFTRSVFILFYYFFFTFPFHFTFIVLIVQHARIPNHILNAKATFTKWYLYAYRSFNHLNDMQIFGMVTILNVYWTSNYQTNQIEIVYKIDLFLFFFDFKLFIQYFQLISFRCHFFFHSVFSSFSFYFFSANASTLFPLQHSLWPE